MTISRRSVLHSGLAAGAALVGTRAAAAQPHHGGTAPPAPPQPPAPQPAAPPPGAPQAAPDAPMKLTRGRAVDGAPYTPVVMPNGSTLPFTLKDGVKVFHLTATPVAHQFAPGLDVQAWGYNGTTPGPLLEAVEGDHVRIYVTNGLPEPTTVHWHGVPVPNGMDGVGGLTQDYILPGRTFRYEFTFPRAGTFLYHPHFDEMTQIALGMVGMIVVHPRKRDPRRVRDYALLTHEWKVPIGAARPDPLAMNDFNVLTFNGKAFPATEPLVAEVGDLVRIRLGNLGPMDHHPIHLHGHAFDVVETDGGVVPPGARHPETTVLVPVGTVRVIELVAVAPGDWPMHCHMTHHVMNQMGHDAVDLIGADTRGLDAQLGRVVPGAMAMGATGTGDMMTMAQPRNSIAMKGGRGPFDTIAMGGMFTIVKVRDRLDGDVDPGWYRHPPGTVASEASADELARDGIDVGAPAAHDPQESQEHR
ncbi:MAG TPA: copper oxidase [Kofleriaceae bacterium]|nr:copper oxidase [Kofleriaceae bacterium]